MTGATGGGDGGDARAYVSAIFNILDDINDENGRLQDTQRATLNILDDFTAERQQRVHAEQELRQLNVTLEQRVSDRTAALATANGELEAFSYSVSHDLRAPLRALQGFSKILLEEHAPSLPAEAQHYIGLLATNASQMGLLIDDLLRFSRLGRQSMSMTPVDLGALARQAFEQLGPALERRTVDLRIGTLPPCMGDATLLRQVLVNLLSNAVKFTRARVRADIEVGAGPPDPADSSGQVVYFVRDNGVGFDMQYADKLFGVFQRLHSADAFDGTGVGLAIVQRIVHRHHGRIWAHAVPDQGATFYFSLPEATVS